MTSRTHIFAAFWTALSLTTVLALLFGGIATVLARTSPAITGGELSAVEHSLKHDLEKRMPVRSASPGLSLEPDWTVDGDRPGARLGGSVGTAGDVNGDGYSDILVTTSSYTNGEMNEGAAFVYHGSPAGPGMTADWFVESDWAYSLFGFSASTAGDVNGDGYDDVIVGAPYYSNGQTDEGRVYLYYGSPTGLAGVVGWTVESNQADARLGTSVSAAGDVNGDGYDDVVVGAPVSDHGHEDEGQAFVYLGSAGGLNTVPDWMADGNQWNARYGCAVAGAGDVDGDGYDDVIIGARNYSNNEQYEGRVLAYHGSATGLSPDADWTTESNQANAHLGWSVAAAGDVNGDGYADIIVGAQDFDDGEEDEGAAFVYHGSLFGISPNPEWIATGDQAAAAFGESVATAADVNCDGYADVVVGVRFYDGDQVDEGAVMVYHGSTSGLNIVPDWITNGWQTDMNFGCAVGTAGDIDDNRCSDLAIGAPGYDGAELDGGAAFAYYGHPFALIAANDSPTILGSVTTLTAAAAPTTNVTYTWRLGDGTCETGAVVTHTYPAVGIYTPVVTASNSVVDVVTTTVVTITDAPILTLTATNDSPTILGSVTTLTATAAPSTNVTYTWALGDGTCETGAVVTHTYPAVGIYTPVVTASNSVSEVVTTTVVTITDVPILTLTATNDSPTALGLPTLFTATIAAGSNVSYTWEFQGGEHASGAMVSYTYPVVGWYTAVVTASNSASQLTATTGVRVLLRIYLPLVIRPGTGR